jgi:superfamily II DNA or RNA helicase
MSVSASVELRFFAGTLEILGLARDTNVLPPGCAWDPREDRHRAAAMAYGDVVRALIKAQIPFSDSARRYEELTAGMAVKREPRPYQTEALAAWLRNGGRGVVVLPTGAGKTLLAHMAIENRARSTLVVTPTLDLVRQWHEGLGTSFGQRIGLIGGGEYELQPLTVTTYDSAYLHMESLGARFGLIVFDECHHLPGPTYALAARLCLAPLRLGLTATPERGDGRESELERLIGATVYRKDIGDLSGAYLSDYETVRVNVQLTPEERQEYETAREIYRDFIRRNGIAMGSPHGWSDFIMRASRSDDGRRALAAYRRQREIAFTAPAKLAYVERLLEQHRNDRVIIFTEDNATVYLVSRRFLVPAITHRTKVRERTTILQGLTAGTFGAVATSRVLNEGVDIPEANVAIVMSGSGSVREHVQRLGRVLRKRDGKSAVLYELVASGTSEAQTSVRRRDHVAYR